MAKRGIENDFCSDIDLADTFIGQIQNAEVNKSLDNSPSKFQMNYGTDNIQLLSDHSRDNSLNKVMINYLGLNLLMNSIEILRFLVCLVRPSVKRQFHRFRFVTSPKMGSKSGNDDH